MANQKDTGYHRWTEEEMKEVILKVAQRPKSVTAADFLKGLGMSFSKYGSMKKRYLQNHPKPQIPATPVVALAKPADFRAASPDTKRQLLVEYNKLRDEDKRQWREAHNAPQYFVSQYNRKFALNGLPTKKKYEESQLPALLSEYMALDVMGAKAAWLKERGLNHQSVHDWKKKLAKKNGTAALPARRIEAATYSHTPPPISATAPTLAEGVNYLEIKRDIFNEVIEDLKRVLAGAR